MMNKKLNGYGMMLLLFIILIPLSSSNLFIDKKNYSPGETVSITITDPGNKSLSISSKNNVYKYLGGLDENLKFNPQEPGVHSVKLYSGEMLFDEQIFYVDKKIQPFTQVQSISQSDLIFLNKDSYYIGEIVEITITQEFKELSMIADGKVYKFLGNNQEGITFTPRTHGIYTLELLLMNDQIERKTFEVVFGKVSINAVAKKTFKHQKAINIVGSLGNKKSAILRIEDNNSLTSNAEINFEALNDTKLAVKRIVFKKLNTKKNQTDFRIESVPLEKLSNKKFIDAFAIDPTNLEFESAEVTIQATGRELWKCKDYNYSTQTCYGEFEKIATLIPGREYTFTLTPDDPLFTQTGYLTNANFDSNIIDGWTTLTEGQSQSFAYNWVSSDSGQNGVAEMASTVRNKQRIGNYYQTFALTIPAGTTLEQINFSALWRINQYDQPGNVYLWIQDSTQSTTYCSWTQAFSSTTSWATAQLTTGVGGCLLSSFSPGTTYTFRMRCDLNTGTTIQDERCHWDEAGVIVYYNDTTVPVINTLNETPDPVPIGGTINLTANITDNIEVASATIELSGTNYSMTQEGEAGDIWYYDSFDTDTTPGIYNYYVYANDTSSNEATRLSGSFEISDETAPIITLLNPQIDTYTTNNPEVFYYNVSDVSTIANCSLIVDGSIAVTNYSVTRDTTQNMDYSLPYGYHEWRINCTDSSTNANENTSELRNITFDNVLPVIGLEDLPNNGWYTNNNVIFNYTPVDDYFENCSLWGNFSGSWNLNQTHNNPANNSKNSYASIYLSDGSYLWNVQCFDKAGNEAWNATNYTVRVDGTPPIGSNLQTNPSSGVTYAAGASYQFNITWQEALNSIDTVWIEHNLTGTLQTDSPTGNDGDEYYFNIVDLAAGIYQYKWYANDTLGNINSTTNLVYVIVKANSEVNLTLNGTDGDFYIGLSETANLTGYLITPSNGYIELYREGVMINNGTNYLTNISQFYTEQAYNITVLYPATQNYSRAIETHYIIVTDTTSPTVGLDLPLNDSWEKSDVTLYYIPSDNIDIANCTLLLNGTINETKNATKDELSNFTLNNLDDGSYFWDVNCSDSTGNTGINGTPLYFNADGTLPTAFNLLTPASSTIVANLTPTFTWQATTETNFNSYTIQIDNDQGFGSINYQYNTYEINNVSYDTGPLTNQIIWYWRVIANDNSENSRTSNQVFNYTTDTTLPTVTLNNPTNDSWSNTYTTNFYYTPSDFTEFQNCSLIINQNINQTNTTINNGVENNFTLTFTTDADYNWSVECYDSADNRKESSTRILNIDTILPDPFNLLTPLNNTLSNNNDPLLNWSATVEDELSNYTVRVSNTSTFTDILYTYYTYEVSNTSHQVTDNWPDRTYYWYVTAYDKASNERNSTQTFIYRLDATPPTTFSLSTPIDTAESKNRTPLLNWTQTSDQYFTNYTVYVSDNQSFPYNNFTYTINSISTTEYQVVSQWTDNSQWYWYVEAKDNASNSRNSTQIFAYLTDNELPTVNLETPLAGSNWTSSGTVTFNYNVSDIGSINNCILSINGSDYQTDDFVTTDTTESILQSLDNDLYNWSIRCEDKSGNIGYSTSRLLTVNVNVPEQKLWETAAGAGYTPTALINLSYDYDAVENSVTQSVAGGGGTVDFVNATYTVGGSGFIIPVATPVNFSGVFLQSQGNAGYVSWWLYFKNSTGEYPLCNFGNDDVTGAQLGAKNEKLTVVGNCTSPTNEYFLLPGDNMTMRVTLYNSFGSARDFDHYWDNADDSWALLEAYRLGILNAVFVNITDQQPGEGESFIEQCNVTCSEGLCLNTQVYLQRNSSSESWTNVGLTGNIIKNISQSNPVVIGNLNGSTIVNFSLIANTYSSDNKLRCVANSTYSNDVTNIKNLTVVDNIDPNVTLVSPASGAAFDPQTITFKYTPYDIRLSNCTLWGNFTGVWNYTNQTNSSPANGENNTFDYFLDYGFYIWNIKCFDEADNSAFASSNRSIIIAGDLEITSANITFSNNDPVEGANITLFANVTNNADKNETNVIVQFWDGDPDFGGTEIGNDTIDVSALSSVVANKSFITSIGQQEIFVIVDPPDGSGSIIESDETNNKANNSFFIEAWQIYYGDVNGTFLLDNNATNSFSNWLTTTVTGNIFMTDSDTSNGISWSFLIALTRNTSDQTSANTLNDFSDIDTNLGTSGYIDSVNNTYSENGLPKATASFSVFNSSINNIPIINSTNNSNFVTGILWDSDDSSNGYYDTTDDEDLVFITQINEGSIGKYGTYDYEITFPSDLKSYKGATETIDLYFEIE